MAYITLDISVIIKKAYLMSEQNISTFIIRIYYPEILPRELLRTLQIKFPIPS